MLHYLKLIRWPNLIMMIFIMLLVRYKIIVPAFEQSGFEVPANIWSFILLIAAVFFTAAGGYIVNDISDQHADRINKPEAQLVGKSISVAKAWWMYRISVVVALGTSLGLGWFNNTMQIALLVFLVNGMLWFYSQRYQCIPLLGNIVVAIVSALVVVIGWLLEFFILQGRPEAFTASIGFMPGITGLVMAYTLFAFLISLIREIVKDIEDKEGDAAENCNTLAVRLGTDVTKNISIALLIILLIMIGFWVYVLIHRQMPIAALSLIPAAIFSLTAILRLAFAKEKQHYSQASMLLKMNMLSGILTLLFLP